METIKNEKVLCRHCKAHVGNKHVASNEGYHDSQASTILVPTKNGKIKKTKVRGTYHYERFGDMRRINVFIMETQFACQKCLKHTTVATQEEF